MAEPPGSPRRLPPQDPAAERGVLGGILVHGEEVLAGIAATLSSGDFYDRRHGHIFEAMLALYDKGQPVDEITVTSRLDSEGRLEAVGGPASLADMADMVLGPQHVDHYAQLVRDKALLRGFIAATQTAMEAAYSQQAEPDIALEEAERAIFAATQERSLSGVTPIKPLLISSIKLLSLRTKQKGLILGVPTGFAKLDELTGGFQPGDLIIIAGRPSMGKTAFALNIASNACLNSGISVAVFSLEMSKEQLALRLLSSESRVSASKMRSGFMGAEHDWPALTDASERLSQASLFIDDTAALSVLELRAKARRLKTEHNLGLVLVDYLQLMRGRRDGFDSREQEISDISRSLKALAKELNIPVVALSQLNRKVEDRPDKRPMLSDLRESGAIEQDADVIAFIYRKKMYKKKDEAPEPDDNMAIIDIGKQRNGPTGMVRLMFIEETTKFEDVTYIDEPEEV